METKPVYPETAKEQVTDNYFGVKIEDPYRWLEDEASPARAAWIEAQNRVTNEYLAGIPFRNEIKRRITDLLNYERISIPVKIKGKYYFSRNDGLQNQSVLYVKDSPDGESRTVFDPNTLSEDGTVALTGSSISGDGKYLACNIARKGSDWTEILVINVETGLPTGDHILWTKFSHPAWHGDGFYYSAYRRPAEGAENSDMNENHTVYYHRMGEAQSEDVVAYRNIEEPKRFYHATTDHDRRLLFINESGAGSGNNLLVKDLLKDDSGIVTLTKDMEYVYLPIEIVGNKLYILTNYNAPKYRIMTANLSALDIRHWKELIPESESVLAAACIIGRKLVLTYEKDAFHRASVYSLRGRFLHEICLPEYGSVVFSGDRDESEAFYSFTSFTFPPTIFRYDLRKNKSTRYLFPAVGFNPDDYTTEQAFCTSRDGTLVPVFFTYRKGLRPDGRNPVLLYGYGGFNISLNPNFSAARVALLERGVIYASANIRGGGEYGESWHKAGVKLSKQNVFDDFIAAAEYFIQKGWAGPAKIAVMGGSNGGLLVGAVVNRRPDLFAVAVPQVGVMDMLRYQAFTIGWNWAGDYGTSDESVEMFRYLLSYSPLHNIRNDGTKYPAILVTTADHDDRVVPAHSFKYAATLQASDTGNAPKLIRIETDAGHGSGKPLGKQIEETADIYSFILYNLMKGE